MGFDADWSTAVRSSSTNERPRRPTPPDRTAIAVPVTVTCHDVPSMRMPEQVLYVVLACGCGGQWEISHGVVAHNPTRNGR